MGADFADDYAAEFLADGFATAFRNIGAAEIADLFVDLGNCENEQALAAAVSNRLGYDYRTVADYVSRCMDRPSEKNE